MDISERNFEATIEAALLANGPDAFVEPGVMRESRQPYAVSPPSIVGAGMPALGGYRKRAPEEYDRGLCLLPAQPVQDPIRQYRADRDPRELLFAFGRCLAHFAVDPDLVFLTTQLEGPSTRFLPFNQGKYRGAGNPPNPFGFATAYLWQRVWARDSVLELGQRFVHIVEDKDDQGRKTGQRHVVFPRYHHLDAVRRLVAHAPGTSAGQC